MHAASWERSILCLKGCGWGKRRFISGGRGRFCCSLETERTFIEYSEARRRFVLFHRHVWRKYRNRRDSSSGLPWYRSVCSRDNTAESLHHRPHSGSTTIQSATRILSAQDVSTYLFSYIKRRPWMPANADRIASLQRSFREGINREIKTRVTKNLEGHSRVLGHFTQASLSRSETDLR